MKVAITEEIIARQPPEAQAIIRLLLARIAELEARIEELERQAKGKTPQNSSLPPSTQHPHARPQPPKGQSKKKRGGQPGHEKHQRPLIPTEDCHHVEACKPGECRRCGAKLSGDDPEPWRHQVWELPATTAWRRCPSRSSRSTSGTGWCAPTVAKRRVGNCPRACRRANRGRG